MTHAFLQQLRDSWPPRDWQDVTVVVGVSAGPDSVALLRGLVELREAGPGQLRAAHFNHQLRGQASLQDESFTRDLCRTLDVPIDVGRDEGHSTPPKTSEAAARDARYAFLTRVAKTRGARFVVTAHTADDQAETILHRIIRGTGVAGLKGIPRSRSLATGITLLRPLLTTPRRQIVGFLTALAQAHRQDESNQDWSFTRNRIRGELLPHLADHYNPRVRDALLRLGTLADDAQQLVESLGGELLERCLTPASAHQISVDCRPLEPHPAAVRRELLVMLWKRMKWPLQPMTFAHWQQLAEMLAPARRSPSGQPPAGIRHHGTLPGGIVATRSEHHLRLERIT